MFLVILAHYCSVAMSFFVPHSLSDRKPSYNFRPLLDKEHVVYSSSTEAVLPVSLPPYPPSNTPESGISRSLQYRSNVDFFMAFVPKRIDFTGPLLEPFNFEKNFFPIRVDENRHHLRNDVRDKWQETERTMRYLCEIFKWFVLLGPPPTGFRVPIPSEGGYSRTWDSAAEAQNAAWRSREIFVSLFSLISFFVAASRLRWPPLSFWCTYFRDHMEIDPTLINILSSCSFISDHEKSPRVGAMVDVLAHEDWHFWVPVLFTFNIPVWFQFGPLRNFKSNLEFPAEIDTKLAQLTSPRKSEAIDLFKQEVERYRHRPQQSSSRFQQPYNQPRQPSHHLPSTQLSVYDDFVILPAPPDHEDLPQPAPGPSQLHGQSPPPDLPQEDFPEPDRESGQLRGQTWRQFFAARDLRNAAKREKGNADERRRWADRKRAHDGEVQRMPGLSANSPVTFIWINKDGEETSGFLMRRRVQRNQVEDCWDSRHRKERIYDEISNQWDLCKPAAEGEVPSLLAGVVPWEEEQELQHIRENPHVDKDGVVRMLDVDDDGMVLPPDLSPFDRATGWLKVPDNLESFLERRLSFTPGTTVAIPPKMIPLDICLKILLFRTPLEPDALLSRNDIPQGWDQPICEFVSALSGKVRSLRPDTSHLVFNTTSVGNPHARLLSVANDYFRIEYDKYTMQKDVADDRDGWTYRIVPLNTQDLGSWDLFVDSALTALQIIRCGWGPTMFDLACQLVIRGIRFSTFIRRRTPSLSKDERVIWRQQNQSPTHGTSVVLYDVQCYNIYVAGRESLLKSVSHLRAALRAGGIIWRLAIEVLELELVFDGPCPYVDWTGRPYIVGTTEMWDDVLTERDQDYICGVYNVSVGREYFLSLSARLQTK